MATRMSQRRSERGAAVIVIILIAFLGLVLLGALFAAYAYLSSHAGQSTSSVHEVSGSLTSPSPFPATVSSPVTLTYTVTGRDGQQTGAGPAVFAGAPKPEPNAQVTFILSDGDASVGGQQKVTVVTNAAGIATAVLAPVKTGSDTLRMHLKAQNSEVDDTDTFRFETIKK
jgi:hypothetical protein